MLKVDQMLKGSVVTVQMRMAAQRPTTSTVAQMQTEAEGMTIGQKTVDQRQIEMLSVAQTHYEVRRLA